MRLICGWKAVLKTSASVRCAAVCAIIIVAEPVVTYLVSLYTGPDWRIGAALQSLAGFVALAGVYARLYPQDNLQTIVTPPKSEK